MNKRGIVLENNYIKNPDALNKIESIKKNIMTL